MASLAPAHLESIDCIPTSNRTSAILFLVYVITALARTNPTVHGRIGLPKLRT